MAQSIDAKLNALEANADKQSQLLDVLQQTVSSIQWMVHEVFITQHMLFTTIVSHQPYVDLFSGAVVNTSLGHLMCNISAVTCKTEHFVDFSRMARIAQERSWNDSDRQSL